MGSQDLFRNECVEWCHRAKAVIHTNSLRMSWPLQSTPDRIAITVNEDTYGAGSSPRQDQKFGLVDDRYGWFHDDRLVLRLRKREEGDERGEF